MTQLDFGILDWVQTHLRCAFLDAVVPAITLLGEFGAVWILLALVLLMRKETRTMGVAVAVALAVDVLLCNGVLKPLIARPRPFTLRPEIELLVKAPWDYSFPSGHTAASFAAVAALFQQKSRLWIPALVLGTAIALSRIYLYVHYPSDVLCGVILGILCGLIGGFFAGKWNELCKKRKK